MCTVLQLTERLLLDYAQRLPESKVQYVEHACCHCSVPDPCMSVWAVERVGLRLCTTCWALCFCVQLVCSAASLAELFVSPFPDSTTGPLLQYCWVAPGMLGGRPIKQLRSSCPLWEVTNWPMGSWKNLKWFSVLIRWVVKKLSLCWVVCVLPTTSLP